MPGSEKWINLDINLKKEYLQLLFKYRIDSNGIGAHGKVQLSKILAFRDRVPAYVSTEKYDTSFKKTKYAIIY